MSHFYHHFISFCPITLYQVHRRLFFYLWSFAAFLLPFFYFCPHIHYLIYSSWLVLAVISYVLSLQVYMNPLLQMSNPPIDRDQVKVLFGPLAEVMAHHELFYTALTQCTMDWGPKQTVGNVFMIVSLIIIIHYLHSLIIPLPYMGIIILYHHAHGPLQSSSGSSKFKRKKSLPYLVQC